MDEAKLQAMLEEATSHCYDEEDEFWAVFSALTGRISFPFQARVAGETVTLVGLDGHASGLEAGVMARVRKEGAGRTVSLAELDVLDPDPVSAEWLEVYRYWLRKRG